jgi:hypothetical protein
MVSLTLPSAERLGAQRPRLLHVPDFSSSTGEEACELAAMAGLEMDPWQQFAIHNALGERPDGKWAAFEVGIEVPRQNGKGGILETFGLAGLFLLGEQLIIHSAHEFATAEEALERMSQIIEGCSDLSRRVRTIKHSHGQEGIYLTNGQRLRYKTRTKGGGRGFSADRVILDEAMVIPESFLGALMPTLSARPNPQLVYTGSAVDQEDMEHGVVFSRVRERAVEGKDPSLAYFGWSPPFEHPDEVSEAAAQDPDVWAQANPALGIRISEEHIAKEQRSMDPRTFAVERLGVGDWPKTKAEGQVISVKHWLSLTDPRSEPRDPVVFVFDVTPDRSGAAIGIAGLRDDGLRHVEVVDHRRGTGWVCARLVELVEKWEPAAVLYDEKSPGASLAPEIVDAGVKLTPVNASEHAQACGMFYDAVQERTVRHLGTPEIVAALRGVVKRPLSDAWAWSRKNSSVDISPLVVVTLALWGTETQSSYREPLAAWA